MVWEYKKGEGIWSEYVDSETGQSSIELHEPKTIWKSCPKDECVYEITGNREATCKKCGAKRTFVVGKEIFKQGKFYPR